MKKDIFLRNVAEAFLAEFASDTEQDAALQSLETARMIWRETDIREALMSDRFPLSQRMEALTKACNASMDKKVIHTLALLIREGAFKHLPRFIDTVHRMREQSGRAIAVLATTPAALSPEQRKDLQKALETHFDRHVLLTERIEASVLGGVKLTSESWEWDGTVRGRFHRLAHAFQS